MADGEIKNESNMNTTGGVVQCLTALMPGRAWGVVLSLAALSIMGLVLLWYSPDRSPGIIQDAWMFKRQAASLGIGLSAFALAWMIGWRRWMRAASWLALAWMALFVIAICSPQVNPNLSVRLGAVQVNILVFCPLAVALLLAWIAERIAGRRTLRVLLVVAAVSAGAVAVWTLDGYEGIARIFGHESVEKASPDEVLLRHWALEASGEAIREANWFSGNREVLLRNPIPGRCSYSMPFAASREFGKFFNVVVLALFGVLAAALACSYRKAGDAAKKVFIASMGLFILSMVVCGYSAYFGFVPPMLHTCVPLVSYGGGVVGITWLVGGILVDLVRDDDVGLRAEARRSDIGVAGRGEARRSDM